MSAGNENALNLTVKKRSKKRKSSTTTTSSSSSSSSTYSTVMSSPTKTTIIRMNPEIHCGCLLENGHFCLNSLTCKKHRISEKRLVTGRSEDVKILLARKTMPIRQYDPTQHCGVDENGQVCTRSLTCKFHKITDKRLVVRPVDFDFLMETLKQDREFSKAMKEIDNKIRENPPINENIENTIEISEDEELDDDDEDDVYVYDPNEKTTKKLRLDYNDTTFNFIP